MSLLQIDAPDAGGIVARRIVPLGRLISAHDAGCYADAVAARNQARLDAMTIRTEAAAEASAHRAAARAEGLAEAYSEIAATLFRTEVEARAAIEQVAEEIANAIADGVAQIIGALDHDDAVARAARQATAKLLARHGATLRVSPSCVERVRDALTDRPWIEVAGDPALGDDDCEIATAGGRIRAGLNRQLDGLRAVLVSAAASSAPTSSLE
jgi:flagellar biosynthesis/type III secretory pathway protein FliH